MKALLIVWKKELRELVRDRKTLMLSLLMGPLLAPVLIIGLAIPISVISTFTLMYFYGFSLNTISFGGLASGSAAAGAGERPRRIDRELPGRQDRRASLLRPLVAGGARVQARDARRLGQGVPKEEAQGLSRGHVRLRLRSIVRSK